MMVTLVRLGWGDQAPCRGSLGLSAPPQRERWSRPRRGARRAARDAPGETIATCTCMLTPGCKVVACRCDAFLGMREGGLARLGARSVVCPWGFREFGLGGEERGEGGKGGAAWSDVVARLLACRRRYVDGGLVRPSVALVDLGVGRGL